MLAYKITAIRNACISMDTWISFTKWWWWWWPLWIDLNGLIILFFLCYVIYFTSAELIEPNQTNAYEEGTHTLENYQIYQLPYFDNINLLSGIAIAATAATAAAAASVGI